MSQERKQQEIQQSVRNRVVLMVINKKQHHRKYRLIKLLGSLGALLLVSSCAVYKTGFECPAGKGQGCKSVTEVNEMVSRGELGRNIAVWTIEPSFQVIENKSKYHKLKTETKRKRKNSEKKISKDTNTGPSTEPDKVIQEKIEPKADTDTRKTKKACGC